MALSKALFTSNSDEWATPSEIFDQLNAEFGFDLDVCATEENHKCERYFTAEQDGLGQKWGGVPMLLQSTIQPDRGLCKKGIQREPRAGDAHRPPHPRADRYEILPRVYIPPRRDPLHQGKAQVWE